MAIAPNARLAVRHSACAPRMTGNATHIRGSQLRECFPRMGVDRGLTASLPVSYRFSIVSVNDKEDGR
jgi:hypothetical protein